MPNIIVMMAQAAVSTGEVYFIGGLGAEALAGVSLVFPLIMLMQTMSAGGMGGGVASAVARALGAGRRRDANALALHALVIASLMGVLFTTGALWGGPALYRAMGGAGGALAAALAYSNVVFAGALGFWIFNTLASVVRGAGNMLLPAGIVLGGGGLTLVLSPALISGWGPLPQLGIAGAGFALITYYGLGSLVLLGYLRSSQSLVRLTVSGIQCQRAMFWEILRIGVPGSLNTLLTNLNVALLTSLAAPFGTLALAGYGIGARLEYLQIPLVFGVGSALVTMVGTNMGAGYTARAQRVAWVGAGLAAVLTGSIGLFGACFPHLWLRLFSSHPEVLVAGTAYLRIVAPTYGCFGLGLALYFASQGAGRLLWPLLAGGARLAVAAGGGWIASRWFGGALPTLFTAMAVAFVVYAVIMAVAIKAGTWPEGAPQPVSRR
jgi:putative MATE family efflux protein